MYRQQVSADRLLRSKVVDVRARDAQAAGGGAWSTQGAGTVGGEAEGPEVVCVAGMAEGEEAGWVESVAEALVGEWLV